MENVDRSGVAPAKAYDLKGSQFNRKADQNDFVGLDKNFNRVMTMGASLFKDIMEQFKKDVRFLVSMNIMDYSCFLSIHNFYGASCYETEDSRSPPPPPPSDKERKQYNKWVKSMTKSGGHSGVETPEVFFLGIIDILQQYDTKRKVQTMVQGAIIRNQEISVVDPERYGARFLSMLEDDIKAGEDKAKKKECVVS